MDSIIQWIITYLIRLSLIKCASYKQDTLNYHANKPYKSCEMARWQALSCYISSWPRTSRIWQRSQTWISRLFWHLFLHTTAQTVMLHALVRIMDQSQKLLVAIEPEEYPVNFNADDWITLYLKAKNFLKFHENQAKEERFKMLTLCKLLKLFRWLKAVSVTKLFCCSSQNIYVRLAWKHNAMHCVMLTITKSSNMQEHETQRARVHLVGLRYRHRWNPPIFIFALQHNKNFLVFRKAT